jgi:hypothetical protein
MNFLRSVISFLTEPQENYETFNIKDTGPITIDILIAEDVANESVDCAICLSIFLLEDQADMLICGHFFHQDCYQEWKCTCIKNNVIVSCPVCRG